MSTVLLASILSTEAEAAPSPARTPAGHEPLRRADYDSREALGAAANAQPSAAQQRAIVPKPSTAAVKALHDQLGVQGIVDIDPATGTPRRIARLDGFLTGPSKQRPETIARDYVAAHPDVFGLDKAQVAALQLRQDYVDIEGIHHLSFIQTVAGVPVFGNGLKAHVIKDGRLLQVDGSPLKSLPVSAASPALSATTARADAVKDVSGKSTAKVSKTEGGPQRTTTFTDRGNAKLVYLQTAKGPRLAWQTIDVDDGYEHVIDAATGQVLYRHNLVDSDNGDAGDAFANYPGAPKGGTQQTVDLSRWLPKNAAELDGNVAHVYSDVNDDNVANPTEEIPTQGRREFEYPFTDFSETDGGRCSAAFQCSWNSTKPNSWQVNREQNAVQMLKYIGTWHDHLEAAPIGFTRAAGNFEAVDGDALQAQSDDGANTANGLPDAAHFDNANMQTPPDGISPTMQMYLWIADDQFIAGNSGDTSDVVYHEYTHGLSNRLVVDPDGNSTLGFVQAGAMGEAWSDFYAQSYLVDQGLEKDTGTIGDVRVGKYVTAGGTIRSEPLDCTVGAPASVCPGTPAAGRGGYTYGDFGKVSAGGPEVHADGEIWAQTLWDLRKAVGSTKSQSLVTRAMELSPANPSFLDERNSILAADLAVDGGKLQKAIWSVFAKRGMGFFAATIDGNDAQPVEDFSMPPAANTPRGTLTGKIIDQGTHAAVAGVTVTFGGHASGFAGDYVATAAADGSYTIKDVLPGTYPEVFNTGAGYDTLQKTLTIRPRATLRTDWQVRRDWAGSGGGATVASFTGVDNTPICGPGQLIDQSAETGWGSDVSPTGQNIVVRLSNPVNVSQIVVNPSATCGDDSTASTAGYRVETSADGSTWKLAASGMFAPGTVTPTPVKLAAGTGDGIGFVRYTMLTSQAEAGDLCTADPALSGCVFLDSTELSVYGTTA